VRYDPDDLRMAPWYIHMGMPSSAIGMMLELEDCSRDPETSELCVVEYPSEDDDAT